jgi:pSer/pThr/pTyr-binding forkhead associated (FHA) protein
MTQVLSRPAPALYRLEIWRNGVRQSVESISKNVISIGRGSKSKPVDVALAGDPEISRRHLSLTFDEQGNFSLLNEGRNPAMINNRELAIGQTVAVTPGTSIAVCSYLLRIQPK